MKYSKTSILKDLVDEMLETENNVHYPGKKRFKPSSLGTPCHRRLLYEYFRVEKDTIFPAKNIRQARLGDSTHNEVRAWLKRALPETIDYLDPDTGEIPIDWRNGQPNPEFPVRLDEFNTEGYIDGIIRPNVKDLWLLEAKTKNDKKYDYIKAPLEEDFTQANFYAHLFEEHLESGKYDHMAPQLKRGDKLTGILMLYINRGTGEWKEFLVQPDPENFADSIEKMVTIEDMSERQKLPKKTPHFCPWCDFKDKCQRNFTPW